MFAPVYRLLGRVGWLFVALFLFLIFAVTGLTALYFWLETRLPPWAAMGLIALVAGVASGAAALWATRSSKRKAVAKVEAAAPRMSFDALVRGAATQDPVGMALAALAAGILIESVPQIGALVRRLGGRERPTVH
ncbi:MAG: hypothetical protein ACM30I_12660 [Gemmatimonas sp.]